MVSVQLGRICVLVPRFFVLSIIFLANDMLEDASTDKAARINEESQVDQEDMPSEDSDKDPEFEILFLLKKKQTKWET